MIRVSIKAWNYARVAFSDEKPNYMRKQQYKSFALASLHHIPSKRWFKILDTDNFTEILHHRPRLYLKPFKTYLSTDYSITKKIKIICDTYRFIYQNNIQKIIYKESENFSNLPLKNNFPGHVSIGYDDRYRKEGELVISLFIDHLHGVISSVAFSFEFNESSGWICKIGCLQGRPVRDGQYVTKEAQKLMSGIRPKAFLIEILQEFCKILEVKHIHAIGGRYQAQKKKHFVHIPSLHSIHFSYDDFWKEIGGKEIGENWYALPLETQKRDISEIKSEKRAYYKRRYELMDKVKADLFNFLKDPTGKN
ncbi:DUF535 family protein [Chryseobacterium daeguense]|uniref:DUF535 family protein n=1 Tax=Chryseobacterium daeguense TaxID=412438 RepID=UPI0003FD679A|nr:DUF535 family protein [Chryseobacterium daeguense]